jgi:integrase
MGKDPQVEIKSAKYKDSDTFRTVAQLLQEYLDVRLKPKPRYYNQTKQRFDDFVLPHIGAMPCQSVTLAVIKNQVLYRNPENPTKDDDAIWTRKHVTASETRRHLGHAFNFGIRHGYLTGDNPARWKDGLKDMLPKPSDVHTAVHHPSLDFRKLPGFVQQIRDYRYNRSWPITGTGRPIVSYAIEFLLLFGGRVGELCKAQWKEFDLKENKWNIPAAHTKSGKARSVPLTSTMLAILSEMQKLRFDQSEDARVFFSVKNKSGRTRATDSITDTTLMRVLRERFKVEVHNHGWRSTLKDWCLARGRKHCPEFTIEWWRMQCDHWEGVPRSDQAYGPDRLLEERRILMQAYDDYAAAPPADNVVVPLKKRRSA